MKPQFPKIPLAMLLESDAEILKRAMAAKGMSQRSFARRVVGRDPTTVRRWLAGRPMPGTVKSLCCWIILEETARD